MIIFAQNKKDLVDCCRVTIERNLGSKNEKYLIVGWVGAVPSLTTPTLGAYSDEESAMAELEKIYAAFEAGAKVYRVE